MTMKSGNSKLRKSKASVRSRRGIATVELLIALPLITTAFVTLMFLAHASHKKNGDYHRKYVTGMSRHTLQPPKFDSTQVTTLKKMPLGKNQSLVQGSFPDMETWATTVSQSLDYVPGNFEEGDWKTSDFVGALYKGTGSPEYRIAGMISPSKDKVKALAISAAADYIGNMLSINLSQANEFLSLLGALAGQPASDDFGQHLRDARKELRKLEEEKQELEDEQQGFEDQLEQYRRDQQFSQEDPEVVRLNSEIEDLQTQINALARELEAAAKTIDDVQRALKRFAKS